MRQEAELDNSSEELDVMASVGAWDMVTWKNEGIAVKHEFFFINTRDKEKELPELQKRIEYINSRQTLGKGFTLQYFSEPELGCHVLVKQGWQLTSPLQSKLFLEQFLKLIN